VNYGGLLAEWRIAEVQETIENVYFWALIVFCSGFVLSMSYNVWLLQERDNRERITGAIIAQLSNAHIFVRGKVLETTEAYKKLVAQIDAEDAVGEEQAAQTAANSAVGSVVSRSADAPGAGPSAAPPPTSNGEGPSILYGSFTPKPKAVPDVADQNDHENDAIPLPLKAARFALSQHEQPTAKVSMPEEETEAGVTLDALPVTDKDTEPNDAEDVDAIKLALQKATQTVSVQAAQLATKDAQLRAKDDKITSQRQLVNDLNNKLKANAATGSGAN
jgi:hypothetical protein